MQLISIQVSSFTFSSRMAYTREGTIKTMNVAQNAENNLSENIQFLMSKRLKDFSSTRSYREKSAHQTYFARQNRSFRLQ